MRDWSPLMAALTHIPTVASGPHSNLQQDEMIKARTAWMVEPNMSDQDKAQQRLMALVDLEPAYRYQRLWAGRKCPMRLLGKRCRYEERAEGKAVRWDAPPCICEAHRDAGGVLDHGRLWRHKGTGTLVLTTHPFVLSGDPFVAFIRDMNTLGLRVTVSGASAYFPANSVLVLVERD